MSFRLVQKSVTLNGEVTLILHYITKLVSGAHSLKVVDKAIVLCVI